MTQQEHDEIVEKFSEILGHDYWAKDKSDLQEYLEWLFQNFDITAKPGRKTDES